MSDITDETKFSALLENYKLIHEELKTYQSEMMKCFLYAVVVLGIALGYGAVENKVDKIIDYMPFALLGLSIYFLTLGSMYVMASRYTSQIEKKINDLAKDKIFEYESKFRPEFVRRGFLRNSKGKRIFPLPNVILGIMMVVAFLFLVDKSQITHHYFWWFFGCAIVLGLMTWYVFVIIPGIIESQQKLENMI